MQVCIRFDSYFKIARADGRCVLKTRFALSSDTVFERSDPRAQIFYISLIQLFEDEEEKEVEHLLNE
jgi:hypothetical protein